MRMRTYPIIFSLFLILPGLSQASDYQQWIAHVPGELGGLQAQSGADGINMNMGDINTSMLTMIYGDDNDGIELVISYSGSGPATEAQPPMESMRMEYDGLVQQTVNIQGFEGFYTHDRSSKEASLMLFLGEGATLNMNAFGKGGDQPLPELAGKIGLKAIHASFAK